MARVTRSVDYYFLLLGRILIGGYFVWIGILYWLNFAQTTTEFVHLGISGADVQWIAAAVIVITIAGGLAVVFGLKMRYAALVLALYLIVVSTFAHQPLSSATAISSVLKDIALVGALLYVSATAD
ncbi:MAG: DoxX family protein [Minisyncoccia bacterium]